MTPRIYALRHESEEILAATSCKTSRSKLRFDEIAKTIDEDRAAGLLDQVFNSYNHASVADMAVPVVALEDVSILASKVLESPRRGFYQEKSTRYVEFTRASVYDPDPKFYTAEEILTYRQAVAACFDAYETLTAPMMAWAETVIPADTKNRAGAVRGKAFDSLRYFLPCGTTTQLAARMPANDWCDLIQQLYVGDVPEFKAIAGRLKTVLEESVPTLVKRAEPNPWTNGVNDKLRDAVPFQPGRRKPQPRPCSVELVNKPEKESLVLAQLLYRHTRVSLAELVHLIDTDPKVAAQCWAMYDGLFVDRRNRHDRVPKELETLHYTFDVVMDYGAYRDLQRQRRCTILPQTMTPNMGFAVPEGAIEAGLAEHFTRALAIAGDFAQELDHRGCKLAPYATPMAYLHRSTHIYDLAELYYVGELRTELACHISYRRVVERMVQLAKLHHPHLLKHIRVTPTTVEGAHS